MPETTLPYELQRPQIINTWAAEGYPSTSLMASKYSAKTGQVITKNMIVRSLIGAVNDLGYKSIDAYRENHGVIPETGKRLNDFEMLDYEEPHSETVQENADGLIASSAGTQIKTVDELIAACKIDLSLWQIDREEIKAYQGFRADKHKNLHYTEGKVTGTIRDDGGIRIGQMYAVKVWLSPRLIKPVEDAVALSIERGYGVQKQKPVEKNYPAGDHLAVLGITDVHIGRWSFDGTYTAQKAADDFEKTTDVMLGRLKTLGISIEEILIPFGGDLINTDNNHGTTTAGTWQEMSSSQTAAIDFAIESYLGLIDKALEIARVKIEVIPGNHDEDTMYLLGKVIEKWALNHRYASYIEVDNSISLRKYHEYGKNLIGLTHGHHVKHEKLPGLMSVEAREMWGRTTWWTWLTGHYHAPRETYYPVYDDLGVLLVTMSALCPGSEWEHKKGYVGGRRAAELRLFSRDHGPSGMFPIFVDEIQ